MAEQSGVTGGGGGRGGAGRGAARGGRGGGGGGFGGGAGGAGGWRRWWTWRRCWRVWWWWIWRWWCGGAGGFGGGRGPSGAVPPSSGDESAGANGSQSYTLGNSFGLPSSIPSAGANGPQAKSAGDSGVMIGGMISGLGTVVAEGQAREVMRNRVDQFGVAEPVISANPGEQIQISAADEIDSPSLPPATVQRRMLEVQKQWSPPVAIGNSWSNPSGDGLPQPNPYANGRVPASAASPAGTFPGNTTTTRGTMVAGNSGDFDGDGVVNAQDPNFAGNVFYRTLGGGADAAKAATTAPAPAGPSDRHYAVNAWGTDDDIGNWTGNTAESVNGLTKSGSGTVTLSGNDTYSGETVVNAGKMALGNSEYAGTSSLNMNGGDWREREWASIQLAWST